MSQDAIDEPGLRKAVERVRAAALAVDTAKKAFHDAAELARSADDDLRAAQEEFSRARGAVLAAAIGQTEPS